MEGSITPERIANAIMLDSRFLGTHILVEGVKDIKMYKKMFSIDNVRLTQTWGKYRQRDVFNILKERNFNRGIGIRDADFLRIPGNNKFDAGFAEPIFATDCHDAEVMTIELGVLHDILQVTHDESRLREFEKKHGALKEVAMEIAKIIGCLRLASKRNQLGLSFKPVKPDGPKLKYHKFVDVVDGKIDIDSMINIVWEYSRGRSSVVKSKTDIKSALLNVMGQDYPVLDLVNGHDVVEVLSLLSRKMINCTNRIFADGEGIEDALAIGFSPRTFAVTSLYAKLDAWQKASNAPTPFLL